MSIALYDYDFLQYFPVMFNLELMKIATYYKKQKEIVVLTPKMEPDKYTHFIFRKDYEDGLYDKRIFLPNVQYGGLAFSKDKYIPLPEEIEQCYPDKNLYLKFENKLNRIQKEIFHQMVLAEHGRLSLDGQNIWSYYYKQFRIDGKTRILLFHDYDLGKINSSYNCIKDLINQMRTDVLGCQRIGMKFPVQLYSEQEFEQWIQFNPAFFFFSMQYNEIMNDDFFHYFITSQNGKSISRALYYMITPSSSSEDDFIIHILPKIYRQAILSRTLGIKLRLRYRDGFFVDKRWERIIRLISHFIMTGDSHYKICEGGRDRSTDYTLYRYITSTNFYLGKNQNWFTKEELRDLFQLVRQKNYEVFKMFYEWGRAYMQGGNIVNV